MNTAATRAERELRPFLPSDLPTDKLLVRAATAFAVAAGRPGERPEQIARQFWPRDAATLALIERSASGPATTTTTGWAAELAAVGVGSFLQNLQGSAAAALIQAGQRFDLSGRIKVNLPRATSTGAPHWVAEGAPIGVAQAVLANVQLGPPFKLAIIEALTREVAEHSQPAAEAVITQVLTDAARLALDTAVFSNAAATAVSPAGLLNGVTALTASASTDGFTACLADLRAITDAIVAAGGGTDIRFFASQGRSLAIQSFAPAVAPRVHGSALIPATQLIGVDAAAFASGFDGAPEISSSIEATIHFEDTSPQQIGTAGTPNVVAAPTRSAFQTDVLLLRMILRVSYSMRLAAVAHIDTGMGW